MDEPTFLLLQLSDDEVDVVIDALVAFAYQCEAEGDICGCVPAADAVAERARRLRELAWVAPEQHVRMAGLGRYAHRPQG